jgi:hypothetical protein
LFQLPEKLRGKLEQLKEDQQGAEQQRPKEHQDIAGTMDPTFAQAWFKLQIQYKTLITSEP